MNCPDEVTASSSGTFIAFTSKLGLSQFVVLVAAESIRLSPLGVKTCPSTFF
jgi:hypothetical protein